MKKIKRYGNSLTKPVDPHYDTQDDGQMALGDILNYKYDRLNGSLGFEQEHQGRKYCLTLDSSQNNY